MARASKMGADVSTRDSNRTKVSGHLCAACGELINQGDLLMVNMVEFEGGRTRKRKKVPYHRTCYKTN